MVKEDVRNMRRCRFIRRNNPSEFRVAMRHYDHIFVFTCGFRKMFKAVHSYESEGFRRGKQMKQTFVSIAILIAVAAATLVYRAVVVIGHIGLVEFMF